MNACFGSLLSDNEADLQVEHSLNSSIYFKRKSENQLIRDSDRVKNHRDISSNISRPIRDRKPPQRYDPSIENPRMEFGLVEQTRPNYYSPHFTDGLSPEFVTAHAPDPRLNPCVDEFVFASPPSLSSGTCITTACDQGNAVLVEKISADDDVINIPEIPSDDHASSNNHSMDKSRISDCNENVNESCEYEKSDLLHFSSEIYHSEQVEVHDSISVISDSALEMNDSDNGASSHSVKDDNTSFPSNSATSNDNTRPRKQQQSMMMNIFDRYNALKERKAFSKRNRLK